MRRAPVGLAVAAVLWTAACGGGSDKGAPAPSAPPTTAAVPPVLPSGSEEAGTPFCGLARTYTEKSVALVAAAGDPTKLKAAATDAEAAIRKAVDVAPAAVKADVSVVAATANEVLAGLRRNDYDLARTPEVAKVQEPGFQKSFGAVLAYARTRCGVS